MPSYDSSLINSLQGYINDAEAALNAGNNSGVVAALNNYYMRKQVCERYATDALQVLNNTDVFGNVANQEIRRSPRAPGKLGSDSMQSSMLAAA